MNNQIDISEQLNGMWGVFDENGIIKTLVHSEEEAGRCRQTHNGFDWSTMAFVESKWQILQIRRVEK